jgi:DNA-directed RNA polymerase specialized sigma24 family protein
MAESRHEWFLQHMLRERAALHRYLRRFTSQAEDIEDLVQETYLRVYALPDFEAVSSPRALLFRIAHNLVVERAHPQKSQATDGMGDLLAQLPPLCRRVVVLRKIHRLSHQEIAEVLGVAHSTIEKHVAKGLVRCRDYLRRAGMLDALQGAAVPILPVKQLRDGGDGE